MWHMNLNIKIFLELLETKKTRAQKNSHCYDIFWRSYEEIKAEKLIAEGNDVIKVDIIS